MAILHRRDSILTRHTAVSVLIILSATCRGGTRRGSCWSRFHPQNCFWSRMFAYRWLEDTRKEHVVVRERTVVFCKGSTQSTNIDPICRFEFEPDREKSTKFIIKSNYHSYIRVPYIYSRSVESSSNPHQSVNLLSIRSV